MIPKTKSITTCLILALVCISTSTFAQESTDFENQIENLQEHLKNDHFSFVFYFRERQIFNQKEYRVPMAFMHQKVDLKWAGPSMVNSAINCKPPCLKVHPY